MVCHAIKFSVILLTAFPVLAFDGFFSCGNYHSISRHFVYVEDPVPKWNGNVSINVQLGEPWNSLFLEAVGEWNAVVGNIQINCVIGENSPGSDHDGINQAFFSDTIYGTPWPSGVSAWFRYWWRNSPEGRQLTECDILFNSNRLWDSYTGPWTGRPDFRRFALHEIGHLFGLNHPDQAGQNVVAAMNSVVTLETLQSDDISGVQSLYGIPEPPSSLTFTFGMTQYGAAFQFNGTPNRLIVVMRSSNLVDWSDLTTLENPSGSVSFLDQFAPPTNRFYRAFYAP